MQDDLQTIYQGGTIEQAHLLRNLLEEQGITAWVQNEVLGAAVGGLPPGMTTLPRVDVAAERRRGDIDQRRFPGHRDRLFQRRERQLEIHYHRLANL